MIQVDGLSKYYADYKAIEQISFQINEGEIIGLLGLNGAGKSTILKILGCFLLPSGGSARIGGFSVGEQADEVRKLIGYLPDHPPLYDEMSVSAYLRFVAKLKDVPSAQVMNRVADAMAKTNTISVANARLGSLSHGFRQRVGIAQALVHKPRVLIFDEPINGLDPIQIVEMRDLITSLRGQHTVILSSHILSEITRTCDRILVIDRGHLIAEGSEAELAGGVNGATKLALEVGSTSTALETALRAIPGVQSVTLDAFDGQHQLSIDANTDVRALVARTVVNAGVELLTLKRREDGLENLFLKLVQK